ncbi:MAG: GNAT family N-acetyltransferase [Bacteroidota bacterium]
MKVEIKTFQTLTLNELYTLLQLRSEVFVVEQDCVYQDIDTKDKQAYHVLGLQNNELAAYARFFAGGDYFENPAIGRVVVDKRYRKKGLGKLIVLACLRYIDQNLKAPTIELSAQTYLKKFYEDMGFSITGKEYLEDGIPHIRMKRSIF